MRLSTFVVLSTAIMSTAAAPLRRDYGERHGAVDSHRVTVESYGTSGSGSSNTGSSGSDDAYSPSSFQHRGRSLNRGSENHHRSAAPMRNSQKHRRDDSVTIDSRDPGLAGIKGALKGIGKYAKEHKAVVGLGSLGVVAAGSAGAYFGSQRQETVPVDEADLGVSERDSNHIERRDAGDNTLDGSISLLNLYARHYEMESQRTVFERDEDMSLSISERAFKRNLDYINVLAARGDCGDPEEVELLERHLALVDQVASRDEGGYADLHKRNFFSIIGSIAKIAKSSATSVANVIAKNPKMSFVVGGVITGVGAYSIAKSINSKNKVDDIPVTELPYDSSEADPLISSASVQGLGSLSKQAYVAVA